MFTLKRVFIWMRKKFKKTPMKILIDKYMLSNGKWEFHGDYLNAKNNDIKRNRHRMLLKRHIRLKTLPAKHFILRKDLRENTYYLDSSEYSAF
jgi:hypothetical protein